MTTESNVTPIKPDIVVQDDDACLAFLRGQYSLLANVMGEKDVGKVGIAVIYVFPDDSPNSGTRYNTVNMTTGVLNSALDICKELNMRTIMGT